MSLNRHSRIITCLQEAGGTLSFLEVIKRVNASSGRDYTESMMALDMRALSFGGLVSVTGQGGQAMVSLTEEGKMKQVNFVPSASGRGHSKPHAEQQTNM
ncbi:MAG: hypothetical protein Q7S04_02730 [Candidatus Moranbacteria bacterium]|nr:hypothetical protein [Candidatus Moranbacteria bacterium]